MINNENPKIYVEQIIKNFEVLGKKTSLMFGKICYLVWYLNTTKITKLVAK